MKQFLANSFIDITSIGLPTSTVDIGSVIGRVVALLMQLMGGLAIVFIIWGGMKLTYSRGNPKNVEAARETILYACIGLALSIAAYGIVVFITGKF